MTGLEVYGIFQGLKLHFTQEKYDYTKYGASRVSQEQIGKHYVIANALGGRFNRESLEYRLIALGKRKTVWLNEIDTPESRKAEIEHREEVESFYTLLPQQLEVVKTSGDGSVIRAVKQKDQFSVPPVCSLLLKKDISPETYVALDMLFGFNDKLPPMIWKEQGLRLRKYKSFFRPDIKKVAAIAKPFVV